MDRRKPKRWLWALGAAAAVVAVVGAVLFQPWRLFIDEVVDEDVPVAASAPASESPATDAPAASEPPQGPVELASGQFITHEHETSGTARILQLADGSRVLVLDELATTNGPDLQVWLSDQPVREGQEGWFAFDDGAFVSLGALRGNIGTQQYAIPDDVDLTALSSVSIWCARFAVSFGAASLTSA